MLVLKVLPSDYKYLIEEEKYTSKANFECKLRLRGVNTEELVRKWIADLSARSMVTWKIARTYPNSGKVNVYKAEFRCQHKVSGKQKCMKRSKNTNCAALLRVCIRRYLKGSTSKDVDPLTKLWPCIIELKNVHNHSIYCAEALQYRPIHDNTKEKLCQLFQRGHSPSSAVEMLKIELMLENPEEYAVKSVDTSWVPLTSFCYREYTKVFGHNYRGRDKNTAQADLEALLGSYINDPKGGRAAISIQSDHVIVQICTPVMQRVHKLVPQSKDLAFVRVHGHVDKKSRLFLLTTPTPLGELPLGCIVTDTESLDVFRAGLDVLTKIFPAEAFYGAGFPATIITDEDARKRIPLEQEFPSSLVINNQFNILRQVWEWLCDEKNLIDRLHRQSLYKKFKSLVYAKDEHDLQQKFEACMEPGSGEVRYEQFIQYLSNIWPEHSEWASPYRDNLLSVINYGKTSNYADIISRILDENILQRTRAFNILQLADFVITHFETFWEKRLTDIATGKYIEAQLKIFLPSKGIINLQKIKKIERSLYEVPSETGTNPSKTVDMDLGLCSCSVGCTGKICKHQSAVIEKYNIGQSVFSLMPGSVERKLFYEVGGGKEPEEEFNWLISPVSQQQLKQERRERVIIKSEKTDQVTTTTTTVVPIGQVTKRRVLDIRATDNYAECTEEELDEGKVVASDIGSWLSSMLESNPVRFLPALKTMWRNIGQLGTEDSAATAMHQFGKDNGTEFALISSPTQATTMENLISTQQATEISFISQQEHDSLTDEMELVPVDQNYVPVQNLQDDLSPRYLILVTDGTSETQIPMSMTTAPLQLKRKQILFSHGTLPQSHDSPSPPPRKVYSRKQ